MLTWFTRPASKTWPALIALSLCGTLPSLPAAAQAIAATVNGDPITTIELDEQMKIRRVLKQPASREAALEDLVGDRIKLRQANRSGIDATEASLAQLLNQMAQRANTTSSALVDAFQKQKVNTDLLRSHLRALSAWNEYVKARNKSLSVSDNEVSAALSSNASLGKGLTEYQLQQIVFVIPAKSPPGVFEQKMREAQALRSRFSDCASGLPLARGLPDVAIKPPISKAASSLPEATRKAIEETGKGRLTPPDRSAAGIEMIAVCGTDEDIDQSSIRDSVQQRLLAERLIKEGDRLYKDLRATAVIDKR
jgi:peptidyl-prolyl cis-trans isomerase SurA